MTMEKQITEGLEQAAADGHTFANIASDPHTLDDEGQSTGFWVANVAHFAHALGWKVITVWESLEGIDRVTNILLQCVNPDMAAKTSVSNTMQ